MSNNPKIIKDKKKKWLEDKEQKSKDRNFKFITASSEDVELLATPDMIEDFREFLKEKEFSYKSELEIELENMKETLEEMGKTEDYAEIMADLENQIEIDKAEQFNQSIDYIKRSIKRDILNKLYGEKAFYRQNVIKSDPYVQKAIEILTSNKEYTAILVPNG